MRLAPTEKEMIVFIIKKKDPEPKVYLYGSRVDEKLQGGDIDLLVISENMTISHKVDLLIELKEALGDQRIDLSIKRQSHITQDPFYQNILKTAIQL